MRVLITGHLGYVGPSMVTAFRSAGHEVIGLDVGYFRDAVDTIAPPPEPDREIVRDVRDVREDDLAGIDAIVHLAGLSNDPLGELNPALTPEINHAATIRLAIAARNAGVRRLVFASSCSLYGAADTDRPLDETAPLRPVSAYAESKAACERDLLALADRVPCPVFLRFATAFGAGPRMRFDLVLNNLVAWATTAGEIRVLSDGTPWRPLVHVADMAMAAVCAVEADEDRVRGQAFNIGRNDNNMTVAEIAHLVGERTGCRNVLVLGETAGDARSYRVDFSKAAVGLPGFAPTRTIAMGCDEIAAWIAARKLSREDFQSPRYVRLKWLEHLRAERRLDDAFRMTAPVGRAVAP